MGKLDKITIQNFKSIRDLELSLKPLNIFIGANGVGKSNFVGVFKFLNQIVESNLQTYTAKSGGANSILYFGRKNSEFLSFKLSFDDGVNGYECKLEPTDEDNFLFKNERYLYHNKKIYSDPYIDSFVPGHTESKLPKLAEKVKGKVVNYVYRDLRSWKIYHFHDTGENSQLKQTCDIDNNRFFYPDARNLAAFLYMLKERYPDYYNNIQDTIRLIAPFFDRFNLQPSRLNENKIRLEWKEIGNDDYFNAFSMSDGTLRFVCLATLLLQPDLPSIILLDEPELGLHPAAITLLSELLSSAAEKTQIIVATQSVTLVNQFEPDQIIVMDREDGQSVFRHLGDMDISNWLEDFGIGDLWEKNVFGGRP